LINKGHLSWSRTTARSRPVILISMIVIATILIIPRYVFSENPSHSQDGSFNIPVLIERAKDMEFKFRLTHPQGDNALEIYRDILKVDPENEEAMEGITRIKDHFLLQGDIALMDHVYTDAAWNYYKALDVSPGDELIISKLNHLNKELTTQSEEVKETELLHKKEKQIRKLISKAENLEKHSESSRSLAAALNYYKQVLEVSTGNEVAKEGIERIKRTYLNRAEAAQLEGKHSISILNYRKALELTPQDAKIESRLNKVIQQMEMAELREHQRARSNYQQGQELIENSQGEKSDAGNSGILSIEFVEVPKGEFIMGSLEGEDDENPPHKVKVSDFRIGKYEVTQNQWVSVMGYNPSRHSKCGDCPIENVTWNEIQEFLAKASQIVGFKLRLPTEAEWEYAAGWGEIRRTWSGTDEKRFLKNYSWFSLNSNDLSHPVGRKAPNELGIFDMSGNVWEICSDWYGDKYYPKSTIDLPTGPKGGEYRVIRGGAWHSFADMIRVANRSKCSPNNPDEANGFRVAGD